MPNPNITPESLAAVARRLSQRSLTANESATDTVARLQLALAAARLGDWSYDLVTDVVTFSERGAEIFGIPAGPHMTWTAMRELLHADDREEARQAVETAVANRTDYACEYRVRRKQGGWTWVAANGRAVYDEEGRPLRMLGIVQDISARRMMETEMRREIEERQRAEQKLREREEQLAFISTNAATLLSHVDREGRFRFVNKAFADRWQKAPEDFIGKTIAEVAGPMAAAAAQPFIERVLAGETVTMEREFEYRDIGVRYMKATYSPEYDAEGNVRGWLSAASDLTERWQAEQALRQSEARLRMATRSGKVGLWEWNIAADKVTWTDSLYEIHGVKREDFAGTAAAFAGLIHPEDRGPVERAIRSSLEHDLPYELEFRAVRPGGAIVWLYTNAIVVREDGRPTWLLGATFDITARKQAEQGLRESEARFRSLTKHAPVGIFLTDPNGEPVFVNDRVRELSGLGIEELRGSRWTQTLHPDDRERVAAEWDAAVKRNEGLHCEYRYRRADGSESWVQASAVEQRNASGALVGYIGTLVDITEAKAAGAALKESEKRFRTLASHAPVGIFLTDPQGDTIFVNDTWSAMTGLTLAEAGGGGWARAIHPDDRARVAAEWAEALANDRASTAEYRFVRADGKVTWVQGQAMQLSDGSGKLVGYIGTVADFTARKATEERLREREAELSLIATHAPIILAHCDAEQRFLFVNRAYAERFGLVVEEVLGRTVRDVLGETVHARLAPYIARVLQGETFSFEAEIPYEQIGPRFMRAAYTPDIAEDGTVRGYLCAITDLSDRRAMEEELRRAQQELQAHASELERRVEARTASLREAITQMEEFSYSVSHDLRAPLRAMNAYAQALAEDYGAQLDETARGYLERIQRSSVRMEKLTHDVLSYSRVARAEIQLTELELTRMVDDVVAHYRELQEPAARVTVAGPLLRVRGHESSLGQALANLLMNAVKFVAPGVKPEITVRTEARGERVRIWIEDNGIGIAPEHQERLFQVFERAPTQGEYEGTGIGLAIVRKTVEKMGGTCGVESDGRTGSRFWIELSQA